MMAARSRFRPVTLITLHLAMMAGYLVTNPALLMRSLKVAKISALGSQPANARSLPYISRVNGSNAQ